MMIPVKLGRPKFTRVRASLIGFVNFYITYELYTMSKPAKTPVWLLLFLDKKKDDQQ